MSALATVLALAAGNVALCAGWAPTAEARMACCTDGDCPMHKGEPKGSEAERVISQATADACCAASEQQQNQSAPTFVPIISNAVLGAGVIVPVPVPALVATDAWRTVVPIPAAPIPRHVLLSVFLV